MSTSTSAMVCHQCRQAASQFVYLDGEPTCYNCYNLVERAPSYQLDTTPVSDGLRELREWSGVSCERLARRLGVPAASIERFEQNWASEAEKELLQKALTRLFMQG